MGSPRTLVHEVVYAIALNEQTLAADTTIDSAAFDRENGANAVHELVVGLDVGLWVDGTHIFHLEDSPDNSVWTNVAAADVILGDGDGTAGPITGGQLTILGVTNDNDQYVFGYNGAERYVRLSVESTATTTGLADVVAQFIAANPRDMIR